VRRRSHEAGGVVGVYEHQEWELKRWFLGFPRGERLWQESVDGEGVVREVARRAGEDEELARLAFLARDMGKAFWPDWLFERRLDEQDRAILYSHVTAGVRELERMPAFSAMPLVLRAVAEHHERWDGRGYPHGLRGPEGARIGQVVAVADAVSAMVRSRPWRPAMRLAEAVAVVQAQAGRQFHPEAGEWAKGLLSSCKTVPGAARPF
jgi:response regulator RpfG family c-di-GMP phosphodiesterase